MARTGVRQKTWGIVCAAVAAVLAFVAIVVVVSKLRVLVDHPLSFATVVVAVAIVGTVACAREARRSLT